MPPNRKPRTPMVHECSQEVTLERLNVLVERQGTVLLGNGHPEDGLLFMFRDFLKEHKSVKEDVAEIKLKLSLVTQVNNELDVQNRVRAEVAHELEKKREEENQKQDAKIKKSGLSLQTISIIFAGASLFTLLIFQILNYSLNKGTKKDVENLGVPFVSNPRGMQILPSDSLRVKFLMKDLSDTTYN